MNGKYVNEENHQKTKSKLKTIGKTLLIIGISVAVLGGILLIIGITQTFNTVGSFEPPVGEFGLIFVGVLMMSVGNPCTIAGIVMTIIAHKRELSSFAASSTLPVVNDSVNYIADNTMPAVNKSVGGLFEEIAGGISKGIAEGKNLDKETKCTNCGKENKAGAKFCEDCGTNLNAKKFCTSCGKEIEGDDKFCNSCGAKVE